MSKLKIAIGISTNKVAKYAGIEAMNRMLKNLKNKPKFVLFFSTPYYAKHGKKTIKNLVKHAYNILPENTPLIGGTVSGFVCNNGLYIDGVVAAGIYYENMSISYGFGRNVKQNPRKAAKKCAAMIRKNSNNIKTQAVKTKLLLNFISGAIIPEIPLIGKVNYIKSKLIGSIFSAIGLKIATIFGTGVGKEEDVIDELSRLLPEYYFFGGTTIDDFKYLNNYQFLNNNVFTNSIVALAIYSDINIGVNGYVIGHKASKSYTITKTKNDKRVIAEIENEPANKYYFENFLGVDRQLFQFKKLESFYYKTSLYFPLGFDGFPDYTSGTGAIMGNNILLGYKAICNEMYLISVSGKDIVKTIEKISHEAKKSRNEFILFSASGIPMLILGSKSFIIEEIINRNIKNQYLMLFFTNENYKKPFGRPVNRVYSYNYMGLR